MAWPWPNPSPSIAGFFVFLLGAAGAFGVAPKSEHSWGGLLQRPDFTDSLGLDFTYPADLYRSGCARMIGLDLDRVGCCQPSHKNHRTHPNQKQWASQDEAFVVSSQLQNQFSSRPKSLHQDKFPATVNFIGIQHCRAHSCGWHPPKSDWTWQTLSVEHQP